MRNDINKHQPTSSAGRPDECESWEILPISVLADHIPFEERELLHGCSLLELAWRNSTKAGSALRSSSSWN